MTSSFVPVQVAEDGTVTHNPQIEDPRKLRWVVGAASTLPGRELTKYAEQRADLTEKLSLLKSKTAARREAEERGTEVARRPVEFRALHGRVFPADGRVVSGEREWA